jgi:hypothetical protein
LAGGSLEAGWVGGSIFVGTNSGAAGTQQSIGVGRVGRSVLNESFEVSTWKKSEAGGLMSLEGGGSLEVDGSTLVGFNGIDGDQLKKSEGKKGTPQSIAGLTVILEGTMGRGIGLDAASRKKGK